MKYLILFIPVLLMGQVTINWTQGPVLPSPVGGAATGLINGKIYAFGGMPTYVHWAYDIETQTYDMSLTPDPWAASYIKGVVYNDELYVLGGRYPSQSTFRKYDPIANTWTQLTSPPDYDSIFGYGCGVIGDKIYYYFGTWDEVPYERICWEYDAINDSWDQRSSISDSGRIWAGSAADSIWSHALGGGMWDSKTSTDMWEYNEPSDTWQRIDDFPKTICYVDCDFLKGYLFSAGANTGENLIPIPDVYYWIRGFGWQATDFLPDSVGIPHNELTTHNGTDYIFCFGGYEHGFLNTMYIGTISVIGVAEEASNFLKRYYGSTIVTGPLKLPEGKTCKVFDITGRVVIPQHAKPGIYFVEVDGKIAQKAIKVR